MTEVWLYQVDVVTMPADFDVDEGIPTSPGRGFRLGGRIDADHQQQLVGVTGEEVVDLRGEVDAPVDELVQPEQDRGHGETRPAGGRRTWRAGLSYRCSVEPAEK